LPVTLEPLLNHLPAWLLVLFRLAGIFMFGPIFGSITIPMRIKVLLALGLSFCVYPMLLSPGSPAAANVLPVIENGLSLWTVAMMVAMELLIGLIIGYGASLPLFGMQIGGYVVDQQMGLGIAGVFNPELGETTGIISEFYFMLAMTLFIIMGGHRVMLTSLVGSFGSVPLGGFTPSSEMLGLIIGLLNSMVQIAMRIAAPILCLIFLETVAMGFIMRTVPQLNILSIGFALRILAGTSLLVAAIVIEAEVYHGYVLNTMREITHFFMY